MPRCSHLFQVLWTAAIVSTTVSATLVPASALRGGTSPDTSARHLSTTATLFVTAGSDEVVLSDPGHSQPIESWSQIALEATDSTDPAHDVLVGLHQLIGHTADEITFVVDGFAPSLDVALTVEYRLGTAHEYYVGDLIGTARFDPLDGTILAIGTSLVDFRFDGGEQITVLHAVEVATSTDDGEQLLPDLRTLGELAGDTSSFTGFFPAAAGVVTTDPVEFIFRRTTADELASDQLICKVRLNVNNAKHHSGWANECVPQRGESMRVLSVGPSPYTPPDRWLEVQPELEPLMLGQDLLISVVPWDYGHPIGTTWIGWYLPEVNDRLLHISSLEVEYTIVPESSSIRRLDEIEVPMDALAEMVIEEVEGMPTHAPPSADLTHRRHRYHGDL